VTAVRLPATGTGRAAGEILAWGREAVAPVLRSAVDSLPGPARLIAGYHLGWWDTRGRPSSATAAAAAAGKALRPALVLLTALAAGGTPQPALPAAAAVELVHNFSLLHDDVMDGDTTRRHRPTAWAVFGTDAAILAGDALLALGLDVLAAAPDPSPAAVSSPAGGPDDVAPARQLAAAVQRLVEGQLADLDFERRDGVDLAACTRMAEGKTAALLGCAGALGARFGGGDAGTVRACGDFGERLGLAFQIVDDLLGIWGDPVSTGKPVHSDLRSAKKTYPVVAALRATGPAAARLRAGYRRPMPTQDGQLRAIAELIERAGGRAAARAHADRLLDSALHRLAAADPAEPAGTELRILAGYVTRRTR
jgi:geranylgeranyl diphosphate synthase type I